MIKLHAGQTGIALLLLFCGCGPFVPRSDPGDDDDDSVDFDPATLPQGLNPAAEPVQGVVTYVVDGDTAHVEVDGQDHSIRFLSINTPELNSGDPAPPDCYGEEAKARTQEMLPEGTPVWLTWDGEFEDMYGRWLCYVFAGEAPDLTDYADWTNYQLVRSGYAVAFIWPNNRTWEELFVDAEQLARNEGIGMWDACH